MKAIFGKIEKEICCNKLAEYYQLAFDNDADSIQIENNYRTWFVWHKPYFTTNGEDIQHVWANADNYQINFCPFCGKELEV